MQNADPEDKINSYFHQKYVQMDSRQNRGQVAYILRLETTFSGSV